MPNLWKQNTPEKFWLLNPSISEDAWVEAIRCSVAILGLGKNINEIDEILAFSLGEEQYGSEHWRLSTLKRVYYFLKPILPRALTSILRRFYSNPNRGETQIRWPTDPRFVHFQWYVLRQLLMVTNLNEVSYIKLWPKDYRFSFVLTHDIETSHGQAFVREIARLEESLGFRSSFNFVMERYPLNFALIQELRERGFEVGCHGIKHDGKLFSTRSGFDKRASKINDYMDRYDIKGFRSPLTHRNPEWMQALNVEYDLSFFDTDPFEPIPGGVMTIWPYFLGRFIELPYTLVQDYTLTSVLGEETPNIWLEKVDFIKDGHGMALLNSHPDYLRKDSALQVYADFLYSMKENMDGYWHALPYEVAQWWRTRADSPKTDEISASITMKELDAILANY